jgi:hypothetical protein
MRLLSNGFLGLGTSSPTAQLHTTSTIRFQNLPTGTGKILVVDDNGNVSKASGNAKAYEQSFIDNLVNQINDLKSQVEELKKRLK